MTDTAVLLMRFAGPMQSWGSRSRFTRRTTNGEPTKSGVLGLLAAAEGRRRTDPVEDLVQLRVGVRVDRPGVLIRDFQTAVHEGARKTVAMPLSYRYYLADAVFLVAVEGPSVVVEGLSTAIRRPRYPLALGRRSCPPAGVVHIGTEEGSLDRSLTQHKWLGASASRRGETPSRLLVVRDLAAGEGTQGAEREHDLPRSFDPQHRAYSWRWVRREFVANPHASSAVFRHDPFAEVG